MQVQSLEGSAGLPFAGLLGLGGPYSTNLDRDEGVGFMAGAAYEIPDIKLRLAATYYSEIKTTHDTLEIAGGSIANTQTDITMPQAINLELQSRVAENTLLFGSIRWLDVSKFSISPPLFSGTQGFPIVDSSEDSLTITGGLERKTTDRFDLGFFLRYPQ